MEAYFKERLKKLDRLVNSLISLKMELHPPISLSSLYILKRSVVVQLQFPKRSKTRTR